jgi:dTMP kinase
MDWTIMANSICADALRPDVNLFLGLTPEVSFARISQNRTDFEIYENLDNLKATRDKYFEAFDKLKEEEKVAVIDADCTVAELSERIWNQVAPLFE